MHRNAFVAILAGLATGCAYHNEPQPRTPQAQAELDRMLEGRVAGESQRCLPRFSTQDMVVIDGNTILFRDGRARVWRNELVGRCNGLGTPGRALLTRQWSSGNLCRGEIAQVIDTTSQAIVGSCSLGDFVPYTQPGG